VRGYRENLLLADRGAIGSAELSHPLDLTREDRGGFDWGAFSISAFADAAHLRNAREPHPGVKTIAGVGVALAWNPSEALSARIAWAEDLKEVPVSGSRDLQDRGFHFRVTLRPLKLFR
jgi:hemolysin activation/secretion protein